LQDRAFDIEGKRPGHAGLRLNGVNAALAVTKHYAKAVRPKPHSLISFKFHGIRTDAIGQQYICPLLAERGSGLKAAASIQMAFNACLAYGLTNGFIHEYHLSNHFLIFFV
jgi:hypothetical protein